MSHYYAVEMFNPVLVSPTFEIENSTLSKEVIEVHVISELLEELKNLRLDSDRLSEKSSQSWQQMVKMRYEELFFDAYSYEFKDSSKRKFEDVLSKSIFKTYQDNVEAVDTLRKKFLIWSEFDDALKKELGCQTMVFGSTFTLCATKDSDLDIIAYVKAERNHSVILNQI